MPILCEEPNVYPADLFTGEGATGGRKWWVLHSKPRQEKALARQMLDERVPFYLPLLERKTVVRGRVVPSRVPLFAGYVFLLADHEERIKALATRRVVRSLEVQGQQELWSDLAGVDRLISAGLPVTPEQKLYPGALVEIRTGPLAGLRGKIIREATRRRFVVQVNFIHQGASVTLDDFALAAVRE
jgi:transcription antitermination factor NusG